MLRWLPYGVLAHYSRIIVQNINNLAKIAAAQQHQQQQQQGGSFGVSSLVGAVGAVASSKPYIDHAASLRSKDLG